MEKGVDTIESLTPEFIDEISDSEIFPFFDYFQNSEKFLGVTYSIDDRTYSSINDLINQSQMNEAILLTEKTNVRYQDSLMICTDFPNRTIHSKIYCFFNKKTVTCIIGSFNLTNVSLYYNGEAFSILTCDIMNENFSIKDILDKPSMIASIVNDTTIESILDYISRLFNKVDNNEDHNLSDIQYNIFNDINFVNNCGKNSLKKSIESIARLEYDNCKITYASPFLSRSGIKEFLKPFQNIQFDIVTNDPISFKHAYDSNNFISSIENLGVSSIDNISIFLWQKSLKEDFLGYTINCKFLHLKIILIELYTNDLGTDIFAIITSANLSDNVWNDYPENHECGIIYRNNENAEEILNFINGLKKYRLTRKNLKKEDWLDIRKRLLENDRKIQTKEIYLRDQVNIQQKDDISEINDFLRTPIEVKTNANSGINEISAKINYNDLINGGHHSSEEFYLAKIENRFIFLPSDVLSINNKNIVPISIQYNLQCDFSKPDIHVINNVDKFLLEKGNKYYLNINQLNKLDIEYNMIICDNSIILEEDFYNPLPKKPKDIIIRNKDNQKRTEIIIRRHKVVLDIDPFQRLKNEKMYVKGIGKVQAFRYIKNCNINILPIDFNILFENNDIPFFYKEDSKSILICPIFQDNIQNEKEILIKTSYRLRNAVSNEGKYFSLDNHILLEKDSINNFDLKVEIIPENFYLSDSNLARYFIKNNSIIKIKTYDDFSCLIYNWGQKNHGCLPKHLKNGESIELGLPNTDLEYRVKKEYNENFCFLSKLFRIPIRMDVIDMKFNENYFFNTHNYPYIEIFDEKWRYENLKKSTKYFIECDNEIIQPEIFHIKMKDVKHVTIFPLPNEVFKDKTTRIRVLCIPKSDIVGGYSFNFICRYRNGKLFFGNNLKSSFPYKKLKEIIFPIYFNGKPSNEKIFGKYISQLDPKNFIEDWPYKIIRKGNYLLHMKVDEYKNGKWAITLINTNQ